MPPKGTVLSDDAKQKLREARARQIHPSLVIRGVTWESLREAEEKGLKWCSGECKGFVPKTEFAGKQTNGKCKKCVSQKVARLRAGLSDGERRAQADYFFEWRTENDSHVRRKWLEKKYNVTPEWYDETLVAQGGHCALCPALVDGRRMPTHAIRGASRLYLLVDHDHETGKARGLLCAKCNTALHRVEYIQDWATKALAYLARYR